MSAFARATFCIGCGGPAPIPVWTNGEGPYCHGCDIRPKPRPPMGYPTAFSCWGHEEHLAIERVLASGQFTMGPEVLAFEREFAAWHGKRHAIMVNSGSSANLVMIAALRHIGHIKQGDKVMVPAIAWSTTYAPLVQLGLDLVLIDVDDTWNASLDTKAFDEDATLVVGCSILGNPANLEGWRTAAGVIGAMFVEDNCESLGAVNDGGDLCGTAGLMSTFSLFHSHQISAIEGGVILTDNQDCADMCRMLRAHGWSRDVEPPKAFDDEYDFRVFGYNVRPLEMHAAVARAQLAKLPGFIKARTENMLLFRVLTADLSGITHPDINGEPSPFGLHFTVGNRETRARVVAALRAADIDCRLPTGGSFRLHPYGQPWARQETPQADLIHQTGLFLGNGPLDLTSKITKAVGIMREVLT